MATQVKCIVDNQSEFDLVSTGVHADDPLNFRVTNGTIHPATPALPIAKGATAEFTTTAREGAASGWACYYLQPAGVVVQIIWGDPRWGYTLVANRLESATRDLEVVPVVLTDASGARLTDEQAAKANSVIARYVVKLQPAGDAPTVAQAISIQPNADTQVGQPPPPKRDKRADILALVDHWMDTSLYAPMVPKGETSDLLARAGWSKTTGRQYASIRDANEVARREHRPTTPVVTSCGDVLQALLVMWGAEWVGAFNIRDSDSNGRTPGAKGLGYYVEATGQNEPQLGDIVVLRSGIGDTGGQVGHVGILYAKTATEWTTADGGGGRLPDQTAARNKRALTRTKDNIPILESPTDRLPKQLDGWIDLDKLPRKSS
ncbi:MAG: hypothetical protein U0414_39150 [Polyangiaceae bacterium]